jgi:hypothetical protein
VAFSLEHTKEREQLRRYYELALFHQEYPMFSLSWTLMHIVDETSAFRDMTPDKFAEVEGALVLNVGGVDDNSAQRLYARHIYSRQDIRWRHRYRDRACRSGAGCCSTTPNSTRSTRRRCEPRRVLRRRALRRASHGEPQSAARQVRSGRIEAPIGLRMMPTFRKPCYKARAPRILLGNVRAAGVHPLSSSRTHQP